MIDTDIEYQRCKNYNFPYTNRTQRRRLFLGAMIANDSWEVLRAVGTEVYNVFHTISFIESDTTQNFSPRKLRFFDFNHTKTDTLKLYQLYGPNTRVSVDLYSCSVADVPHLLREFFQREGSTLRWKLNGMRPEDIAIISDADESFSVSVFYYQREIAINHSNLIIFCWLCHYYCREIS